MVEGGEKIHTGLLSAGLADEIQLAVAPVLVGQKGAPRFLGPAHYPGGPAHRLRLAETRTLGDVVLLRYLPKAAKFLISGFHQIAGGELAENRKGNREPQD
jgi:5-amino-6-(5-phosphoribosylamino)uracil reductase